MRSIARLFVGWPMTVAMYVTLGSVVTSAGAQSWEYLSFNAGGFGKRGTGPTATGYVALEEVNGKATFRFVVSGLGACYQTALDAAVTKTGTTTTITLVPAMQGCDQVRFVISNDGTGGRREVKQGADWVWDGFDRGLTPKK
jgi:hypothetical protein